MKGFAILSLVVLNLTASVAQEIHTSSYYFEKGQAAFDKQQYRTAIAHFNECLRLEPYFIEAYYARGRSRERVGDKQGAIKDYSIYLETKPASADALYTRAVSRYEYGQWAEAKEDFLKLHSKLTGELPKAFTTKNDFTSTLLSYLGLIELKFKNYGRAASRFDSALLLMPPDGYRNDYLVHRGLARQHNGDTLSAIKDFEQVLQLKPGNTLATYKLAILGVPGSKPEEAERLLTTAIGKSPALPELYAERGALRLKTKNIKGALSDYSEAIKLDPGNGDYWVGRGAVKEKSNDLQGAIEDYSTALSHSPEYALAFYRRALVKNKAGRKKEACLDLEQARKGGVRIEQKITTDLCE